MMTDKRPGMKAGVALAILAGVFAARTEAATRRRRSRRGGEMSGQAKADYKANDMLNRGVELLDMKQEERGLKMVASVPRMFPKSKVRFKAHLALGRYYAGKRQHDLATRQFRRLAESEDDDELAEGLYQTGVCYYHMNDFDKAFMSLRKVTGRFPTSVHANEAYYYIGQCHFKLGRWAKAVEALKMVGTSVPANADGEVFAEAGQRLFVKIHDKDLVVLMATGEGLRVDLTARSGDTETVTLEPLGKSGEHYVGSVPTVSGRAAPGDETLQIIGGDVVTVDYVDRNTEDGKREMKRASTIRMVSTAAVGFTDGAYREYTRGVFGDTNAFIRVRDLDRDRSGERDRVYVKVMTEYTVRPDEGVEPALVGAAPAAAGTAEEALEEVRLRDSVEVELVETGAHTGVFVGTILPKSVSDPKDVNQADDVLSCVLPHGQAAARGDEIVLEYLDKLHMEGAEPRDVRTRARLLIGQIRDVKIEHREVASPDLKARKQLIEAKIFLKLGGIFKDLGLVKKANERAAEGLERVEDVIRASLKTSLDRGTVEEAFSVKWDLLLVQDKLREAIGVCRTLMRLYPDSSMVDKALLKIGFAKMEGPKPSEAIGIFGAVVGLKHSDLRAEAQFRIGEVHERMAIESARKSDRPPNLGRAMQAYRRCSESFPDSSFAGDSLDKIADYYISTKDYARASELMERVFQDYPDASFLDKMLLKWIVSAYREGNYALAKTKVDQFLSEYPNSDLAEKARKFRDTIAEKLAE
jgi:TolA-binding protein